jgi:hypothetical protein
MTETAHPPAEPQLIHVTAPPRYTSEEVVLPAPILTTAWYMLIDLLLLPYRLIRQGQRRDYRQALQHREQLVAVQATRAEASARDTAICAGHSRARRRLASEAAVSRHERMGAFR